MKRREFLQNTGIVGCCFSWTSPAWAASWHRSGQPLPPDFEKRLERCLDNWLQSSRPPRPWAFYFGQTPTCPSTSCFLYDPKGRRLVLWELHTGEYFQDLSHSRRQWDLNSDVADDVAGSTYLLQTQEAEAIIACCLKGRCLKMQCSLLF